MAIDCLGGWNSLLWRDKGCAVEVHDRREQEKTGQRMASRQDSVRRSKHTKYIAIACNRSDQHSSELNEKSHFHAANCKPQINSIEHGSTLSL